MINLDTKQDQLAHDELTQTVGNIYADEAKMSIRNADVFFMVKSKQFTTLV